MTSPKENESNQAKKTLAEEAEELRSLCSAQPPKGPKDNGKRLVAIPRGDNEELRLVWSAYDGHSYLNVSLWRLDSNGAFRPVGEKTMSVRKSELADFADGVSMAIELARQELERRNWDE
jgi:hypothetical protein